MAHKDCVYERKVLLNPLSGSLNIYDSEDLLQVAHMASFFYTSIFIIETHTSRLEEGDNKIDVDLSGGRARHFINGLKLYTISSDEYKFIPLPKADTVPLFPCANKPGCCWGNRRFYISFVILE